MKTKVFGKKIENTYEVDHKWKSIKDENGENKTVYTDRPTITRVPKVKNWVELCSYEGEPKYNSKTVNVGFFGWTSNKTVNISEDDCVAIEEEIFRADLNEMHLHGDKVVETIDTEKEDALSIYEGQIKAFNKMMIKSNNKLMAYCDLHKLVYEDTDCIDLFKLVFPDEEYVIEDGVMKVKETTKVIPSVYGDIYVSGDIATLSTGSDICTSITSAISSRS